VSFFEDRLTGHAWAGNSEFLEKAEYFPKSALSAVDKET